MHKKVRRQLWGEICAQAQTTLYRNMRSGEHGEEEERREKWGRNEAEGEQEGGWGVITERQRKWMRGRVGGAEGALTRRASDLNRSLISVCKLQRPPHSPLSYVTPFFINHSRLVSVQSITPFFPLCCGYFYHFDSSILSTCHLSWWAVASTLLPVFNHHRLHPAGTVWHTSL